MDKRIACQIFKNLPTKIKFIQFRIAGKCCDQLSNPAHPTYFWSALQLCQDTFETPDLTTVKDNTMLSTTAHAPTLTN